MVDFLRNLVSISPPSMVIQPLYDANILKFQMWSSYDVSNDITLWQILSRISLVVANTYGGGLVALIIHCHSFVQQEKSLIWDNWGSVVFGLALGSGFYPQYARLFKALRNPNGNVPLAELIWITACKAAEADRYAFCKSIADYSGSKVLPAVKHNTDGGRPVRFIALVKLRT